MASMEHPEPQRDPYAAGHGEPVPGQPQALRVLRPEAPTHLPPPGSHQTAPAPEEPLQLGGAPESFLPPPPQVAMQAEVESAVDALLSFSPELPAPAVAPLEATPPAPEPAPAPVVELAPPPAVEAPAPSAEPAPAQQVAHRPEEMRDLPLGTLIHNMGLVGAADIEAALEESVRDGKRLGEVLLDRGLIAERDLGRLLAGQKGLPFVDLGSIQLDPQAATLLPVGSARLYLALPIRIEDGVPVVAVCDPTNQLAIENVRRALGVEPRFAVASRGDILRAIASVHGAVAEVPAEPAPPPALAPESVAELASVPTAVPLVEQVGLAGIPPSSFQAVDLAEPAHPSVMGREQLVHRVYVRLSDGDRLELGAFAAGADAHARAREVMRIVDERRPGDWPCIHGRFLRPETIVSIDIVDELPRY
ncbi:MAG: hypothetical protein R3C15_01025 [Thermoleophilia bacterium]